MQNIHFNCTSTLENYKCAIAVLVLLIICYFVAKVVMKYFDLFCNRASCSKGLKCIRRFTCIDATRSDIIWFIYNFILPFLLISLISDVTNFMNNMIFGFMSIMIILLIVCLFICTKFKFILLSFIKDMDKANIYVYSYLDLIRSITHVILFLFGNKINYRVCICIAFAINLIIVFVQSSEFLHKRFMLTFNEKYRKEHILIFYEELWSLFIIGIITMNRVVSSDTAEFSLSQSIKFIPCLMALFITSCFCTSFIVLYKHNRSEFSRNEIKS